MSTPPVEINLEFTPNPNTLKYTVNRRLLAAGAEYYTSPSDAADWSPLAVVLFEIEMIDAILIGPTFVTITLAHQDNLRDTNKRIIDTIRGHLEAGLPIATPRDPELTAGDDSPDVQTIIRILDEEIRPAVAMDGGDISFQRFEDGVVYLYMKGACAGCPSSSMTLKMGIETRLKAVLGDDKIRDVVALD
jgi:Fe-S cluster biogenesis protein NfuA